jgi:D-serine dehydratase
MPSLHHNPQGGNKTEAEPDVHGMTLQKWCHHLPVLGDILAYRETIWFNPATEKADVALARTGMAKTDIMAAARRLERFRPFLAAAFPETAAAAGLIESPLRELAAIQTILGKRCGRQLPGRLLLKCDNLLPIAGSVKARGGIYEVLKYAEEIALKHGLLPKGSDSSTLDAPQARAIFAEHRIAVGSTGNLGISIGIIAARLGLKVSVHMSAEARQWKKDLLRLKGVEVIEHQGDYSRAVAEGRRQAASDPRCHFVDDENSIDLFLGYAVAAERLQQQLLDLAIKVDRDNPLFVYLPCGVGGAPGGITFGLKHAFGDHVHCFFAEPSHAPCMLLGLCTGLHDKVSIQDFGLDGKTSADGLSVGRPSGFIGKIMAPLIDGVFTVDDAEMFRLLTLLADAENIRMEPSALAGMAGPMRVIGADAYQQKKGLGGAMSHATHLVWGTGGLLLPEDEMTSYYRHGRSLLGP